MTSNETAQGLREIVSAQDGVRDREEAYGIICDAAVRMEQLEIGWRCRMSLEARADNSTCDRADHDRSSFLVLSMYRGRTDSNSGK